jgi:hypothetical protein
VIKHATIIKTGGKPHLRARPNDMTAVLAATTLAVIVSIVLIALMIFPG